MTSSRPVSSSAASPSRALDFGRSSRRPAPPCAAAVQQGIPSEKAKAIVRTIKDRKLKVQASIQADQVRVSGRNKDDLQATMALLRGEDFGLPLQFTNYR